MTHLMLISSSSASFIDLRQGSGHAIDHDVTQGRLAQ
jgi:hypothetical protein